MEIKGADRILKFFNLPKIFIIPFPVAQPIILHFAFYILHLFI